jgi:hypothetical protein
MAKNLQVGAMVQQIAKVIRKHNRFEDFLLASSGSYTLNKEANHITHFNLLQIKVYQV